MLHPDTLKKLEKIVEFSRSTVPSDEETQAELLPLTGLINVIEHYQNEFLADWWHPDDVIHQATEMGLDLTFAEAHTILEDVIENQDAAIGINWDVIREAINAAIPNIKP